MALGFGIQAGAAGGNSGSYGSSVLRGFANRQWGPRCKQAMQQMMCETFPKRDWKITNDLQTVLPNFAIDDPMARYNQTALFQASLISGREGTDYANPYLFLANMFVTKAELAPAFSTRMQTPEEVTANIVASSNAFQHKPPGRLH